MTAVHPSTKKKLAARAPRPRPSIPKSAVATELVCIIDRSGSIVDILSDAQGGLDNFLAEQAMVDGVCFLTLHDFDTQHSTPISRTRIQDAKHYKISPRGGTSLYDAVGRAIKDLDAHAPQGNQVIVMIVTDGMENSSFEYSSVQIKQMIEERQGKGWSFVFVGVGIDAFQDGGRMGVYAGSTLTATTMDGAYASNSSAVTRSRLTGTAVNYTSSEREDAIA